MKQFPYEQGLISMAKTDYDYMYSMSDELAYHFERCVGLVQERYRFVYDPDGKIEWDDFCASMRYVEANIDILTHGLHYHYWKSVADELAEYKTAITITSEPVAIIIDSTYGSDDEKIVPVYEEVMLSGSRSYYVTKRGKLMPSSHKAHIRRVRYSPENLKLFNELDAKRKKAYLNYRENYSSDILLEKTGHERINALGKVNFAQKYPNAPLDVVCVAYDSQIVICRLAFSKGHNYYDEDGNVLRGSFFLKKDDVDYESLLIELNEARKIEERLREEYIKMDEEIDKMVGKINRIDYLNTPINGSDFSKPIIELKKCGY